MINIDLEGCWFVPTKKNEENFKLCFKLAFLVNSLAVNPAARTQILSAYFQDVVQPIS